MGLNPDVMAPRHLDLVTPARHVPPVNVACFPTVDYASRAHHPPLKPERLRCSERYMVRVHRYVAKPDQGGKMKSALLIATVAAAFGAVVESTTLQAADDFPAWAYGFTAPPAPGTPKAPPNPEVVRDNVTKLTLPGSKLSSSGSSNSAAMPVFTYSGNYSAYRVAISACEALAEVLCT